MLLASAVVAAIVSGIFGYFISANVEKFKAELSGKESTLEKLDEAYQKIAKVNWGNADFSSTEISNDPPSSNCKND